MALRTLVSLLLCLFAGTAAADVTVVATVPSLAALAREVGGARVKVTSLALPTQDPHFVDAKPSLALELNRADLLLAVGLKLESGWLPVLQQGARNPKIQVGGAGFLDCSQFVSLRDVPTGAIDRSQGDVHPGGNPHYLYDPRAAAAVARGIAARLGQLDPANQAAYQKGLADFLARLETARAGWEKRLAASRGAPVISYHKSFVYLADWLGLVEVAYVEPKPGVPPTAGHVAQVLGIGRGRRVKVILQEGYYPDNMSQVLAQRIPATRVMLPGGADVRAGQSYIAHLDEVVARLEKAFRG